jgi:hypothetical protein
MPQTRRLFAVLPLLIALLLASCTQQPTVLTGTITDAYTGKPVNAASVTIGETTLTTDANGNFSTTTWKKEDTLQVGAASYEPLSIALAERSDVQQTPGVTVTLSTALRPNTLAGTLTDSYTGKPLAGAALTLSDGVSTTLQATSDATGRYAFEAVPENVSLTIAAPGYAEVQQQLSRTTSFDSSLRPNTLAGVITDRYTDKPVAGATVSAGGVSSTSGNDGSYRLENLPEGVTAVEISADGYAPLAQQVEKTTSLDAVLRPDTLKGRLIDKESGEPLRNATILATTTLPGTDVAFTRMVNSSDGSFTLNGLPEQGYLQVLSPGYRKQVIEIKPGAVQPEIAMERFTVKALYITAAIASVPKYVDEYVDLIEKTELNTLIIDLKSDLRDDLGLVYYDSQVPLAKELGLAKNYIDMAGLVKRLKEKGIYTIARVQLFSHDNVLSDARPEWSIRLKENGKVYADYPAGLDGGIRYAYLDPTNQNVWDYNIALGVEAAMMGFDEVNYDYIRFPDWFGDKASFTETLLFSEPIDPANNPDRMFEVITEFMERAHRAVNGAGAMMSIDVFGRVVLGKSLTIAQDIKRMGKHTDYIAPMPYPSLWWPGAFDLPSPVESPYEVIDASTKAGLEQIRGQYARLRPWLQDHTDPWSYKVVTYGPAEVRAQIDALEKYPEADGWMLYDSANAYRGAFGGAAKPEQ